MNSRRRAGQKAWSGGESWESFVSDHLDLLARRGLLVWHRSQQPFRAFRHRDGKLYYIPLGKGPTDYHLLSAGLSLALEAKSCSEPRWYLAQLKAHQAQALEAHGAQGGYGAIALWHRPTDQRVVIPWSRLRPIWMRWHTGHVAQGEASLTAEQIGGLGVVMDTEGAWVEWFRRGSTAHPESTRAPCSE